MINGKQLNLIYEPVIGLEVHVELNTKSKMFCHCSADYFGKEPNTHTCPVCLGLPGALPYVNQEALEKCTKIGLALNCSLTTPSLFERKNYFYPDLPKGYQISQYRWPLCVNGSLDVEDSKGDVTKIRINRVHQEEDTAKLMHKNKETLIDFNRSGVPLVEIVTEPDFRDTVQIRDYAKKLQQIFRYLNVSSADMEKGDMRLEANVSVRKVGEKNLPNYRVELKNINSFRFMVAAVEYEIKRQIEILGKKEKLVQETRGWDENKKQTFLQRSKEEANDYRYFPEPDLPEIRIKQSELRVKKEMPELANTKVARFIKQFGVSKESAKILTETMAEADFFETAAKYGKEKGVDPKQIANYIVNNPIDLVDSSCEQVVDDLIAQKSNILDDEGEIERLVKEVTGENPKVVADYKKGKEQALQALIGAVVRKSGRRINISKVKSILEKMLH